MEAQAIRFVDDLGRAVASDEDDRHVRVQQACLREDFEAGHPRHLVVEHHEIERLLAHELDGGLAPVGALDGVAERLQHVDAEHDHRPRVIDDQDLLLGRRQFAWARAGTPAAPFVSVS